jgi:hypothetical protein
VAHNALAVADVWDSWETDQFLPLAALNFPVPKNEFVNLMRRTNDLPVGDIEALYADVAARQALLRTDSLPAEPGSLAAAEPAAQDNDIYDTKLRLIFYDDPIFGSYDRDFRRIFSEPRYVDLRANLRYFADLYAKIREQRRPLGAVLAGQRGLSPDERQSLAAFYQRYYQYIDRQDSRVQTALASLSHMASAPAADGRRSQELALASPLQCFPTPAAP